MKPSLSPYTSRHLFLIKETWIEEVKNCEILKEDLHPNVAQYHSCAVMEDRTIRSIYFTNCKTLIECVGTARCKKLDSACERRGTGQNQVGRWVKGIERGIRHLRGLGIVHNDLNPSNIMFHSNFPSLLILALLDLQAMI
jgi:serine/threonine protein kinase